MYGAVPTIATVISSPSTFTLANPLAAMALKGSVADAWAISLAGSFQTRMQKAGKDIWGPMAIAFDQCSSNPSASDPGALFDVACVAPEPLAQYVGTAAMAEINNPSSPLHQQMRAYLSEVAGKYGAAATQGMIGTFAALTAPLVAGIGKSKTDILSGDAAIAWNNDLQVLAAVPQAAPTLVAQKTLTFRPQTVTAGGTSSVTPAQITPPVLMPQPLPQQVIPQELPQQQAYPVCPAGTFATGPLPAGTCQLMPMGPAITTVETAPQPQSTFQKALPWVAGAAALGAIVWWMRER